MAMFVIAEAVKLLDDSSCWELAGLVVVMALCCADEDDEEVEVWRRREATSPSRTEI